jgi:predicted SAM-dependent methyltransferase
MQSSVNIGCGTTYIKGYIGLDRILSPTVDILADIDGKYLPFVDKCVSHINVSHVLEHVRNLDLLMAEMHRISRPSGHLSIEVPHFSSMYAWTDPTHVRAFTSVRFDYFALDAKNG